MNLWATSTNVSDILRTPRITKAISTKNVGGRYGTRSAWLVSWIWKKIPGHQSTSQCRRGREWMGVTLLDLAFLQVCIWFPNDNPIPMDAVRQWQSLPWVPQLSYTLSETNQGALPLNVASDIWLSTSHSCSPSKQVCYPTQPSPWFSLQSEPIPKFKDGFKYGYHWLTCWEIFPSLIMNSFMSCLWINYLTSPIV